MLWIFVLAIIMPISLANCDDNLATVKWDHAVNSRSRLDAALKSDIQFIEADVVIGTTTGKVTVAVQPPPAGDEADPAVPPAPTDEEGPKPEGDLAAAAAAAAAAATPKKTGRSAEAPAPADDPKPATDGEPKPDGAEAPPADAATNNNNNNQIPIMAHPPADTSDLSLEDFLNLVADSNGKNASTAKGVKLDFKSIEALEKSIQFLTKDVKAPLWVNSDILQGPIESKIAAIDAKKFFDAVKGAKHLEHATLSIGWTTHVIKGTKGNYTEKQVDEMIKTIDDNIKDTKHPITFPVRATFAAESKDTLRKLFDAVSKTKNVTFSIWSSSGDEVDTDKLQDFISSFGVEKVYVDVPKDLKDKLKLDSGAASIAAFGLINVAALVVAMFLRNGLH